MFYLLLLIHKLFETRGPRVPESSMPAQGIPVTAWSQINVGDVLIANADVVLQTHRRGGACAGSYPNFRQFTAGKAYRVRQTRPRTGVVFVYDDAGYRIALNELQGRRFLAYRDGLTGL